MASDNRGIPSGSFEHRFDLADDVRVGGAQMANGLLTIELARVLPQGTSVAPYPNHGYGGPRCTAEERRSQACSVAKS
jgi:hypothetical protein